MKDHMLNPTKEKGLCSFKHYFLAYWNINIKFYVNPY